MQITTTTEGEPTASKLNAMGINVFMLRYRVPPYRHPVELGDAQRAIRMVRSRADEFGINPNRIGMIGFSTGGYLISTAGTHYEAGNPNSTDPIECVSSRPNFMELIYPVISFQTSISRQSPLTANTGTADTLVLVQHSLQFYMALLKAGVPTELHTFQKGGHGFGTGGNERPSYTSWADINRKLASRQRAVR
jgi:acetyl esterase/lipase